MQLCDRCHDWPDGAAPNVAPPPQLHKKRSDGGRERGHWPQTTQLTEFQKHPCRPIIRYPGGRRQRTRQQLHERAAISRAELLRDNVHGAGEERRGMNATPTRHPGGPMPALFD
jgi:hypothetical protein